MLALELTHVADLDVSAASGLVVTRDGLCVIADDELFLGMYDRSGRTLAHVPLLAGALSERHGERKRHKPDLEALALLPDGRLLALGSGSTASRMRAVVVAPADGFSVREVSLEPLYQRLATELPELNIEGAAVHRDALWLAQRGNGARAENALVKLSLSQVLRELEVSGRAARLSPAALAEIVPVSLGELDGVPLGLTDLASDPLHGLLFSAAAEGVASTYYDGPCLGSALGFIGERGQVHQRVRVHSEKPCKIEGIVVEQGAGEASRLWLVADPDDRSRPAPLFSASLNFV